MSELVGPARQIGRFGSESQTSAAIKVVKDASPNDAQDFAFTGSFGGFSLDDDGDATLPNETTFTIAAADLGSKSVTESAVAGWALERGGHLRVGLEDHPDAKSNRDEVERARSLCERHGRALATPAEAAALLDLPRA